MESERVERKESAKDSDRICQIICAFANDLAGSNQLGVLFVGVKDSGELLDLDISDQLLLNLAEHKSNGKILPQPTMSVEKRSLNGHFLAVITVAPSDLPPVRYDGRIWIRTGPRRAIASEQDERILIERRRAKNTSFDLQPITFATLNDLSRVEFEGAYLPSLVAADVLAENHRSYEQKLASCKMISGLPAEREAINHNQPFPTVLGALVLGISPTDLIPCAYIQFLRISGTELSDPVIDSSEINGRLVEVLNRVDEKLTAHITTAVSIQSDAQQLRPNYPRVALQQLIRNAVMHRCYEGTHAPIRVTWFDDRIEIISPGGPYGIVNSHNFGAPGVTDYRNPALAEAMKALGYVQRFGVGIATAKQTLRANGNPELNFAVKETIVMVTVRL
jgi:ATP-dependent DNA helicase RecG